MTPLAPLIRSVWLSVHAQLGPPLSAVPPNPLPTPPAWQRFLLENPWPLAIALTIGAIGVWTLGTRLSARARGAITIACVAGAVGVWALAASVETTEESLRRASAQLLDAAVHADTPTLERVLAPDFSLYLPGGGAGLPKASIITKAQRQFRGVWTVTDWGITDAQAHADSLSSGQTQIHVRVTLDGFVTLSWWKLDWQRSPDGVWRALSAEPTSRDAASWTPLISDEVR